MDVLNNHDESMRKTTSCKKTSESLCWSTSLIGQKNCFSGQSERKSSNACGTGSVKASAQGLSRACCTLSPDEIPVAPTNCPWVSEDGPWLINFLMFGMNITLLPKYQQANSPNWYLTFLLIRLGEVTPGGNYLLINTLSPEYQQANSPSWSWLQVMYYWILVIRLLRWLDTVFSGPFLQFAIGLKRSFLTRIDHILVYIGFRLKFTLMYILR